MRTTFTIKKWGNMENFICESLNSICVKLAKLCQNISVALTKSIIYICNDCD